MKTLTNRMQLRLIQIKTCTSDIRIQVQFSRIQIVLSYVLHNARHATLICLRIVLYPFDSYAYHSCAFLAVSRILSTIHPFLHSNCTFGQFRMLQVFAGPPQNNSARGSLCSHESGFPTKPALARSLSPRVIFEGLKVAI